MVSGQRARQSGLGLKRTRVEMRKITVIRWRNNLAGGADGGDLPFRLIHGGCRCRESRGTRQRQGDASHRHPKLDRKLNDRAEKSGGLDCRARSSAAPGRATFGGRTAKLNGRNGSEAGPHQRAKSSSCRTRSCASSRTTSASCDMHDRKTGGEMNRAAIVSGARAVQARVRLRRRRHRRRGHRLGHHARGTTTSATTGSNPERRRWSTGSASAKFVDFVNGRTTPYDDNGHGTHVAGIIARQRLATRYGARAGIAPAANLVSLKVLDDHGGGYISNVIAAFDWVVDEPRRLQHPRRQPLGRRGGHRVVHDRPADARGQAPWSTRASSS